ncbi:MAG: cation-translocating P-type ATPase [Candidatus Rokubacteria bacterium]|nr:cation-translocating P-type ATPase [Candidatus Rokubacteria bacterium]
MTNLIWHAVATDHVLRELETDPHQGLSAEEAGRRLERYGPNELRKEERAAPWRLFLNQFKNTLIVILLAATVLSALVGEIVDAGIILVIVVFSTVLGFIQEYRAERALEALKKMLTPTTTVIRGGTEQEIPSRDLVPGDIMLLEAGDRIPADSRLIEVHSLKCDEAPLTGESIPAEKRLQSVPEGVPVGDRRNMVFTGTTVTYGRGKAVVTATGMKTEFGKIAEEVAAVVKEETPLERRTAEIGKWLGVIAVSICVLVVGISTARELMGGKITLEFTITMVMFAVALAVAAVPEALAAIVTGALAIGMHAMAKRNALVRKMPAVETLGCTTVICSDKTGTLTKGEMTVRRLYAAGRPIEVSGVGYAPEGRLSPAPTDDATQRLLRGGLLCSDAVLAETEGRWGVRGDPTEGALVVLAVKAGLHQVETRLEWERVGEFPFSSERMRMTTIHRSPERRIVAFMKGAPEVVLERSASLLHGDLPQPLSAADRRKILEVNEEMARDALRVLAVAYRELPPTDGYGEDSVEGEMTFLGLIGMMDPPREEAIEAVRVCQQVHIKPIMITGDHKLTAVAVARELRLFQEGDLVLTGDELGKLGDEEFEAIVEKVTVYARVSPMDKLKIIRAWKKKGEVVAMTGDGVNDAPALKHADIGIYDNIKKYLTYLLRANITEVVVLGGVVMFTEPEFLPLLPAAILYINLATDGLPALALGVAPPDPDIMQRPPRDPKESVFSRDVRTLILMGVLIECPIFLWVFIQNFANLEVARTKVFFLFVIIELMLAINFRSLRFSLVQAPPHKWLLLAIGWELAMIAGLIQLPAVRDAFGITLPTMRDLFLIVALGVGIMATIEVTKGVLRAKTAARA